MTQAQGNFGVKYEDEQNVTMEVTELFETSDEAAAYARALFADNPYFTNVRVVPAWEIRAITNETAETTE